MLAIGRNLQTCGFFGVDDVVHCPSVLRLLGRALCGRESDEKKQCAKDHASLISSIHGSAPSLAMSFGFFGLRHPDAALDFGLSANRVEKGSHAKSQRRKEDAN
jgi:hypothetical protein